MRKRLFALIATTAAIGTAPATAETPPAAAAEADLSAAAWLQGTWEGEGLGGKIDEAYSAPRAGAMAGYFRFLEGEETRFYELCAIVQVGRTLEYRVKHFDAGFKGWEERDRHVAFPLLRAEKDALYFDGLTIRRTGPDTIESIVTIRGKDGKTHDEVLRSRRVAILPE